MSISEGFQLRDVFAAHSFSVGTAWEKIAGVQGLFRRDRYIPFNGQIRQFSRRVRVGDRRDEGLGIRVPRVVDYFFGGSDFDDFTQIHDGNAVTDIPGRYQVMGNVYK